MEALAGFGKLPRPGWKNLKVVVTSAFARMYRRTGREAFVEQMVPHGISAAKLAETPERWVVMVRPSLIRDYVAKGRHAKCGRRLVLVDVARISEE